LTLSFSQDNAAGEVLADNRRLKQMLVNLLSNAVKFTPEGGHVGLEVASEAEGEILRFTVWDDGPGIAPQHLPLLFQPFVQLDSSLSRRYAGTGLGLSLVRRLAELQSGGAGVETELGKGSRFFFALPAAPSDKQSARNEAAWEQVPSPHDFDSPAACLLVCDDHPVNLKAVSDYLRAFGFRIATAANGLEALDRATECGPDLILMDIQMPQMDGLEATRRIRAVPALAGVPIIAVTALAMPGDRERCLEAGANEFMPKPLSLRVLRAKIQELLEEP
jgi:CheY-like chemotaxis protein